MRTSQSERKLSYPSLRSERSSSAGARVAEKRAVAVPAAVRQLPARAPGAGPLRPLLLLDFDKTITDCDAGLTAVHVLCPSASRAILLVYERSFWNYPSPLLPFALKDVYFNSKVPDLCATFQCSPHLINTGMNLLMLSAFRGAAGGGAGPRTGAHASQVRWKPLICCRDALCIA